MVFVDSSSLCTDPSSHSASTFCSTTCGERMPLSALSSRRSNSLTHTTSISSRPCARRAVLCFGVRSSLAFPNAFSLALPSYRTSCVSSTLVSSSISLLTSSRVLAGRIRLPLRQSSSLHGRLSCVVSLDLLRCALDSRPQAAMTRYRG